MRDYWAGPVEKMKTLVRERKTKDVVLAPFEKEIIVGREKNKKARGYSSAFLQSCMNDCGGTSASCATLPITGPGMEETEREALNTLGTRSHVFASLLLCSDATLCSRPSSGSSHPVGSLTHCSGRHRAVTSGGTHMVHRM